MPKIPKRKQHQVSLPDWMWEWGIKNDPLGRFNPAPYLREFLGECISIVETGGNDEEHESPEPDEESETLPVREKPVMPYRHTRTRSHRGGNCWTFNDRLKANLDRWAKVSRVQLILSEADTREVIRVWYDPETMERVEESEGRPYYLLDVTAEGVPLVG